MDKAVFLFLGFLINCFIAEARYSHANKQTVVRIKRQADKSMSDKMVKIRLAAEAFIKEFAQSHGTEVDWYDLKAQRTELEGFNAAEVKAELGPVKYEEDKAKGEGRKDDGVVLYTNLFCNDQKNQNISAILSKTLNRTATFSWQLDENLVGTDADVDLPVPEELGSMVSEFSASANLKDKSRVEASTVDTFNVRDYVSVSPKTVTKAIWILSERKMTVPLYFDYIFSGDIAVRFKKAINGKDIHLFPIEKIKPPKKFSLNGQGKLVNRVKGLFNGVRGLSTNLRTKSHPLGQTQCKNSGDLFLKQQHRQQ